MSAQQTRFRVRAETCLRFGIALVLLTAALMKAHQLATTPDLGEGLLHAKWFNILVVEFELFLGIWLIFGMLPKLTWLVTIGCFSVFALVSLYKAFAGEMTCGCFGSVIINPWITMIFDIGVVVCLLFFRPRRQVLEADIPTGPFESYWLVSTFLTTLVLIVAVTAQVYLFFGSFVGLDRFMTAQEITFEIDREFRAPENDTVQIIVTNRTDKQIRLVGARTDCGCGAIENIPITVPPHSQSHVLFVVSEEDDKTEQARKKQKIVFFVDGNGTQKAVVELSLFEFLARR